MNETDVHPSSGLLTMCQSNSNHNLQAQTELHWLLLVGPNSSHPSHPLDTIRVIVIVWRLRGNIIRTALCWIVWHNVHSQQHTYVSSSYRSNRLGLSHWDPYAVRRGGCLDFYYCNMVGGSGGIQAWSRQPTGFLQCFDTVGLVIWPVKIIPEMTYNVLSGTSSLYGTTTCSSHFIQLYTLFCNGYCQFDMCIIDFDLDIFVVRVCMRCHIFTKKGFDVCVKCNGSYLVFFDILPVLETADQLTGTV